MLQIAGLAAILNQVYPGLGERLSTMGDSMTNKLDTVVEKSLVQPFGKTYKYGWFNGYAAGLFTGIVLTYTGIKVYKYKQQQQLNEQSPK